MYRGMISGKRNLDRLAERMHHFLKIRDQDIKDIMMLEMELEEACEGFQREIIINKIKMAQSRIDEIDKRVKEYNRLLKYHK